MPFDFDMNSMSPIESGGGGSANITSLNVTPTTSAQKITASGSVDGYSPVNVSAVTSSIDANIVAGNIKKDVQILGVTGTYEGGGVTPTGTISITENGTYDVTSYASADVNVAGSGDSKYGVTLDTFLGDVDANGVLQLPTKQSDLVFTGVTDIVTNALYQKFYYCKVKSVSFPELTTVSGAYACYNMLKSCTALTSVSFPELTTVSGEGGIRAMLSECSALTSVSFPNLTTISGGYACAFLFEKCSALTSASFPNLTTISGNSACSNMFNGCTALTDVYFPALTTTSFGYYKDQFNSMMYKTGTSTTHTLHFPSNLESKIQGLQGYPNFGGTSGYVVLSFDLPQTN